MKFKQSNTNRNLDILNEPHSQIEHLRKMHNIDALGEFSLVKREFEETGAFSFTSGKGKISSHADVAYIFKQLENKAIENAFAVLVKNGEPTVLHLGMGDNTSTMTDFTSLIQADAKLKPEQIYFVHNHPSGELKASQNDVVLYNTLKSRFGNRLQLGIIINLTTGKFGVYDESGTLPTEVQHRVLEKKEQEHQVKVYAFSKQVFDKNYQPDSLKKITASDDVAELISSHRLGERDKMGFLVSQVNGNIVGNVFLPYTEITTINIDKIAEEMILKAGLMGGMAVIPYGNFKGANLCSTLEQKIYNSSFRKIRMLDAVYIDKDRGLYASWADNGGFYGNEPSTASENFSPLPRLSEEKMQYSFNFDSPFKDSSQTAGETLRSQPVSASSVNEKEIEKRSVQELVSEIKQRTGADIVIMEDEKGRFLVGEDVLLANAFLVKEVAHTEDGMRLDLSNETEINKVLEGLRKAGKQVVMPSTIGHLSENSPEHLKNINPFRPIVPFQSTKSQKQEKIDDFGEKIGGAKKDLARSYIDSLSSITRMDIASKPLSEVFPRPNYNLLIEEGKISQSEAITMNYLYDNLGKKPQGRKKYGINSWTEKVMALSNDFKATIEHGAMLDPNIFTTLGIRNHQHPNSDYRAYCDLMDGLDFPRVDVRLGSGKSKYKPTIKDDGSYALVRDYFIQASGKDIAEFVEQAKKLSGIFPEKKAALLKAHKARIAEKPFVIKVWHYPHSGERIIATGTRRNLTTLAIGFKTSDEAHTYLRENREALEQKYRDIKEFPFERREVNEERNGEDYRFGKTITSQIFADTFGFRGVEFGNWVNQAERQGSLNEAYDALLDLAKVVGIEPKAISLGGELGLAFGARGSGKANAHYEPNKTVINLTKTRGSGSLAHEWWHAVDNYFAKKTTGFSMMSDGASSNNNGIRNEVSKAWKELNFGIENKVFSNSFAHRSERIDKLKTGSKKYWGTPREMSARAFEAHVVEELAKKGIKNDYLANIRELYQWKNEDVLDKNSTYPYPTKHEREMLAPKFQNLFDNFQQIQNIETRQMMLNEPEMEYNAVKTLRERQQEAFNKECDVLEPHVLKSKYMKDGAYFKRLFKSDGTLEVFNFKTVKVLEYHFPSATITTYSTIQSDQLGKEMLAVAQDVLKRKGASLNITDITQYPIETIFDKIENLNDRERTVYSEVLELAKNGDTVKEFNFDELKVDGFSQSELKGYISQLTQKGLIEKLDGGYYDFQVATTGMDMLQEPIMQYNQTSTVDMDKKIEFLSEKIDDSWFKNAEIDYGIIGSVEKLSYEKEADVLLIVTKEENGCDPIQTIAITHASDYNAEQLYDIWMEQYGRLDMMMLREPEMQYQNKQMTCLESSEKIWQWNDLNISQSELENAAKHAAENYWYDKNGGRPRSPMSEFYDDFGHDTHTDEKVAMAMELEFKELYYKHRSNPEVYMNYVEDLPIMNDLYVTTCRGEPITEDLKKEAVSDVTNYLYSGLSLDEFNKINPEKIVDNIIADWKSTQEESIKQIKEEIIKFHNSTNQCPQEKENIIDDICRATLQEIPDAAKFLENELVNLEVKDIVDEVFVSIHNKTLADYEYAGACRDISELFNWHFDNGTKYLEQSLAYKELEIKNTKIEVGDKELDYDQKFRVLVNKDIVVVSGVTMNNRIRTAIIRLNEKGEVEKEYRCPKEKQDLRVKRKTGVAIRRKGGGI
jgi:hypothetical protein